ncbi:MAG: hypothetical protein ABS34_10430 [Opitutaceae bacterium BACL24 MAG-120322-bin51]|nr:MAG: hypothetical protein ABS34_10430 [Opitutaceae bacterium BACL24 MAG-120322-bin51]
MKAKSLISWRLWIYSLIKWVLPETKCFHLKRILLRWAGATIGQNVRICSSADFIGSGELVIQENTWVGHRVLICCSSSIVIGADVDIAPEVYIGTGTHTPQFDGVKAAGMGQSLDVSIGDGVWLCVRSTICPGISVPHGSIVAAGAVVINKMTESGLVAGVPAEYKKRFKHD